MNDSPPNGADMTWAQPREAHSFVCVVASYTSTTDAQRAERHIGRTCGTNAVEALDGAFVEWVDAADRPAWRPLQNIARFRALPANAWTMWLDWLTSPNTVIADYNPALAALVRRGRTALVVCAPSDDSACLVAELTPGAERVCTVNFDESRYTQLQRRAMDRQE
jgi:hypothetical protein